MVSAVKSSFINALVALIWERFQSPCAGNMFGKKRCSMFHGFKLRSDRFNPRVRGTCLVRSGRRGFRVGCGEDPSFNPRVRGTCLVRPFESLSSRSLSPSCFNPRVRGTCLVSRAGDSWGDAELDNAMFQSPCAGNMFGKLPRARWRERWRPLLRFNPRVRGTCLVSC